MIRLIYSNFVSNFLNYMIRLIYMLLILNFYFIIIL